MGNQTPKGVVFDGKSCGTCSACELRAKITAAVDEILRSTQPEIDAARVAWSRACVAERRKILTHGSSAEEWRVELHELIAVRDGRLNRLLAQHPTIPTCTNMRLTPRISCNCADF